MEHGADFAETILPLIDSDPARAVELATTAVNSFAEEFENSRLAAMRSKIGLATHEAGDAQLVQDLLDLMHRNGSDYTVSFRGLCEAAEHRGAGEAQGAAAGRARELGDWMAQWRARLERDPQCPADRARSMRQVNPAYIPRNHRVEAAIAAAVEHEDFAPFEELLQVVSRPYEEQAGREAYSAPPLPAERVLQTFCGT